MKLYIVFITGRVPVDGYRSQRNHSAAAMGWLTWIEKRNNITLRHAWHPQGEKHLADAHVWVDGYHEETRTCYGFHGCYYHGKSYMCIHQMLAIM